MSIKLDEIRILSCVNDGRIGEISQESIAAGLKLKPDVIVGQGNGMDPGPHALGAGEAWVEPLEVNLAPMMIYAKQNKIPFIFSVGAPAGHDIGLEASLKGVDKIAKKSNMKFRIAVIHGEISKQYVKAKLAKGVKMRRVIDTDRLPEFLRQEDVDRAQRIVGQMGPEPIMKALDLGVDGILTGRALDVALHMALPLKKGFNKGLVALMAKNIECGGQVGWHTRPNDSIFTILKNDHYILFPPQEEFSCTVPSVASHTLYERRDPYKEENPGGYLDLSSAKYEQLDAKRVKVSGGTWHDTPYTVKMEGAAIAGYRTISICGIRDPNCIKSIDFILSHLHSRYKKSPRFAGLSEDDCKVFVHVYGKNGVMGPSEPQKQITSQELGIVFDVVAKTQTLANQVCAFYRGSLLHAEYPERITTGANMATLFSQHDIPVGPTYEFNVWHLMPLEDPCEPFHVEVVDFPRS